MADVAADVIAIIAKRAQPAGREVVPSSRLDELGIDSLSAIEMIFDLEEKFDVQIPYNSNSDKFELETVGQVVDAIANLVRGKS